MMPSLTDLSGRTGGGPLKRMAEILNREEGRGTASHRDPVLLQLAEVLKFYSGSPPIEQKASPKEETPDAIIRTYHETGELRTVAMYRGGQLLRKEEYDVRGQRVSESTLRPPQLSPDQAPSAQETP